MQKCVTYEIIEIKETEVVCKSKNGEIKSVGVNSIVLDGKKVKPNEISTSDKIVLNYKGNTVTKASLQKAKTEAKVPASPAPAPAHQPPNLNSPSIAPAPAHQPPNLNSSSIAPAQVYMPNEGPPSYIPHEVSPIIQISPIQPLTSMNISDESNKATLCSIFSAYRKIKPGMSNLPLAFIIGLTDHSIIYNKPEVYDQIKNTLLAHRFQLMINPEQLTTVIGQIENIVKSSYSNQDKFSTIQGIYESYINELEQIVQNLIKVQAELNYDRKEYESLKAIRRLDQIVSACQGGIFESCDFVYLLNLFKMQMRIIDVKGMTIFSQGSMCDNIFYILQTESNDYCTLYTSNEYYLMKANSVECREMLQFMEGMRNAEFGEKIKILKEKESQIESLDRETLNTMKEIKNLNKIMEFSEDYYSLSQIIGDGDLNEILKEFCCNKCLKFVFTAEFPCGHSLCYQCSYVNYAQHYRMCIMCSLYVEPFHIDSQFNSANYQ